MIEIYNFVIAIYATLIVGAGYIGLWFKYKLNNQDFYASKLKTFDKLVQSIIFGTIAFSLLPYFSSLSASYLANPEKVASFVSSSPSIFFSELILVLSMAFIWFVIENIFKKREPMEEV